MFNVVKVHMPVFGPLSFWCLLVFEVKMFVKGNFAPFVQRAISVLNLAPSCNAAFMTPISVTEGGCQMQAGLL